LTPAVNALATFVTQESEWKVPDPSPPTPLVPEEFCFWRRKSTMSFGGTPSELDPNLD
jgi:hypothetical protein